MRHLQGALEVWGFLDVGVCSQFVCPLDIRGLARGTEHNYHEVFEGGLLAHPREHLQAIQLGQFQVQQNQARERVLFPIRIRAGSGKVIDRHLAVSDSFDRAVNTRPSKNVLQEENVRLLVFNLQNTLFLHAASCTSTAPVHRLAVKLNAKAVRSPGSQPGTSDRRCVAALSHNRRPDASALPGAAAPSSRQAT